jgi:hypothetical protein
MEPSYAFPSAGAPDAHRAIATEHRIGHIVGIDVALGQMFEAGRSEDQRPAQPRLHTIMVCSNRDACKA